jgi:hypothetical protein
MRICEQKARSAVGLSRRAAARQTEQSQSPKRSGNSEKDGNQEIDSKIGFH